MLKHQRHRIIEEELNTHGSVLISKMSVKLNCSEETIRRDLKDLEMQNKLIRTHGGGYLPDSEDKGIPTPLREVLLAEEKERMASYICNNMIIENDVIMLDCSTTCLTLAKQIFNSKKKVTIITNALRIFNLFDTQRPQVNLIAIGGSFKKISHSFSGSQAIDSISNYMANKLFISPPAVDITHGLLDNTLEESRIRQSFMEHSQQKILVADHTKFSDSGNFIIAGLENLDTIVTDKTLSSAWEKTLKKYSLPIHYC